MRRINFLEILFAYMHRICYNIGEYGTLLLNLTQKYQSADNLFKEETMDDPSKRRDNFNFGRFAINFTTPAKIFRAHFELTQILLKL